ncbi:hypothetical protein B0A49_05438 [Cryomyces minteri]|uniref:Uncharacterized protein n=1 Tax=Cryomyces minteri TaxID=331657 RepID=A0A4V5NFP6_9PEZI|nr:hypothetical protein B0A49_05438 [Cryomyces minteri]
MHPIKLLPLLLVLLTLTLSTTTTSAAPLPGFRAGLKSAGGAVASGLSRAGSAVASGISKAGSKVSSGAARVGAKVEGKVGAAQTSMSEGTRTFRTVAGQTIKYYSADIRDDLVNIQDGRPLSPLTFNLLFPGVAPIYLVRWTYGRHKEKQFLKACHKDPGWNAECTHALWAEQVLVCQASIFRLGRRAHDACVELLTDYREQTCSGPLFLRQQATCDIAEDTVADAIKRATRARTYVKGDFFDVTKYRLGAALAAAHAGEDIMKCHWDKLRGLDGTTPSALTCAKGRLYQSQEYLHDEHARYLAAHPDVAEKERQAAREQAKKDALAQAAAEKAAKEQWAKEHPGPAEVADAVNGTVVGPHGS